MYRSVMKLKLYINKIFGQKSAKFLLPMAIFGQKCYLDKVLVLVCFCTFKYGKWPEFNIFMIFCQKMRLERSCFAVCHKSAKFLFWWLFSSEIFIYIKFHFGYAFVHVIIDNCLKFHFLWFDVPKGNFMYIKFRTQIVIKTKIWLICDLLQLLFKYIFFA